MIIELKFLHEGAKLIVIKVKKKSFNNINGICAYTLLFKITHICISRLNSYLKKN